MSNLNFGNQVTLDNILDVINGKMTAIVVPNFYSQDLCKTISKKLIEDPRRGFFVKDNKISRIGMPHFDIVDGESLNKYHDEALSSIENLRQTFYPYLSPIDKLRLLLDETWPAGAYLENLYGRKCFVGLCRILNAEAGINPHTDKLMRDSPDSYSAHSLQGQLAANIYLNVPQMGGGLELWLEEPSEKDYQMMIKETGTFSIKRERLGPPRIILTPKVGDLILFNSRLIHAVVEGKDGYRLGLGAFIGYRGINSPLTYWS